MSVQDDIDALIELLEEEIAEVGQGRFDGLAEAMVRKQALSDSIEAATGEIEAALAPEDDEAEALRDRLDRLSALAARDMALLQRMAQVSGEVARDMKRLRDRHGLGGLYGSDGKRGRDATLSPASMDKSV
ncbi:hypothetical protein [Limimaricola pyoseonensis]|uniref:FlgN protein n=1 Tax=Limimaricola pyoseonensis TaxID=521013 RepID=A0A1G7KBM6_9RHOB|nr:hypothetical protein [Limimaricola pyoseonensis]SDF34556.1 hypothetical protein SAMN04488567_0157 [Limimaricola pyoseonensis]